MNKAYSKYFELLLFSHGGLSLYITFHAPKECMRQNFYVPPTNNALKCFLLKTKTWLLPLSLTGNHA